MSEDEKMSINERRKYLGLIQKRYIKASKVERTQLLDEMEAVTDLHRKSLIRLMASDMKRTLRQRHSTLPVPRGSSAAAPSHSRAAGVHRADPKRAP